MSTINDIEYKGVYTAIITPFNTDQSVDLGALKALVEWQIHNGIQGIVPVGTTGESPTLDHTEHLEVIKTVIEQANGRVPVIAGTGSNNTIEAISLTQEAAQLGASASLQVCPYYNKPSQQGLYEHFSTIAETCKLPFILYNIPGRTSRALEVHTMLKLLKHPMIIGIKEATGNIINTIEILEHRSDATVLSGDDNLLLAIIAQGGAGVISVASNIIPKQMVELVQTALDGDFEKARAQFYTLVPFFKALFIDTNPIPIKYVASKMGVCKEVYRLPLCAPNARTKQDLDHMLQSYPAIRFP